MDERYAIGPVTITIKLSSDETAGKFALIEYELPPGFPGPPPHVHPDFDEMFYVLAGEIRFRRGDDTVDAAAGTTLWCPGSTPHAFSNPSDQPARMLFTLTPGGFEQFFRDVATAAESGMPGADKMAELNDRYGVRVVA
ncbi:MAG TPA: cupin domain-containing protein [Thermoleophilaceae bacterium]|jgi:quercetin dioxygenase-like cupin family protein